MKNEHPAITWQCKPFRDLSAGEMHSILALRAAIFVVEQKCPYQDPDYKDEYSLHVMGWLAGELVAVARILPQGVSYDEVSIGRVATAASVRGTGAGLILMEKVMKYIEDVFGKVPVRISAQSYLEKYYEKYGFKRSEKKEYLEDDIPHIDMLYST
ncbi:MAG TPA: GNAT family N-acetyltransferase [Bacteroidia bacterium]|nr:GNAT family N-acetyltransferase [Bacteroidia bacterium]